MGEGAVHRISRLCGRHSAWLLSALFLITLGTVVLALARGLRPQPQHTIFVGVGGSALVAALVATGVYARSLAPSPLPTTSRWSPRVTLIALFALLLIAAITRGYRINAIPAGLWLDETDIALQALEILAGARPMPWEVARLEVPWLYHYYVALFYKLFGPGYLTVKMPHLLISVLTAGALFLLAREWLSPWGAVLTTVAWSTMRWSLNMSRWGHANTLTLFWYCTVLWLLWRGLHSRHTRWWVLTGLALGLSQYGYQATRSLVVVVALFLAYWLWTLSPPRRQVLRRVGLLWGAFTLVYAPLALTYLAEPNLFLERSRAISIFNPLFTPDPWVALRSNVGKYLGMLHYVGDPNGRHNIPGWPMLDPILGGLVVLGLGRVLAHPRRPAHVALLLWLAAFLTAGILTTEAPNTFRVYGLTPALALLAGLGLDTLAAAPFLPRPWPILTTLIVLAAAVNLYVFFGVQAQHPAVVGQFNVGPTRVGQYIATLPGEVTVYLDREFWGFSPIKVINPGRALTRLKTPEHVPPPPDETGPVVYVLGRYGHRLLPWLRQLYPEAKVYLDVMPPYGYVFTAVYIDEALVSRRGLLGRKRTPAGQARETVVTLAALPQDVEPITLRGGLYVPRPGTYELRVTGVQRALIRFPGQALSLPSAQPAVVTLPEGLVPVQLTLTLSPDARPAFFWRGPHTREWTPIPDRAWYPLDIPLGGLLALWYEGGGFRTPPVRITHASTLYADNAGDLATAAMRWIGQIRIEQEGTYRFGLASDDGSRLWIDDRLVVDNWGLHPTRWVEGEIRLTPGWHTVRIDYVDNGGAYWFEWRWVPPDGVPQRVPARLLRWTPADVQHALRPPPDPPPVLRVVDTTGQVIDTVPVAAYELQDPRFNRPVGDANFQGWPMKVNNQMYDRGIGVYGPGELRFRLNGRYRRFRGMVGIDQDTYGDAHTQVQIWGDDRLLWDSGLLRKWDPVRFFEVDVTGVQVLILRQIEAGHFEGRGDGVDWIDPVLVP